MTDAEAPGSGEGTAAGFHIAFGLGLGGDGEAGLETQFKIGARVSPKLRVYYYALNHWYARPDTLHSDPNGTEWRIRAINGAGLDYFVLPSLGLRLAAGIGMDANKDFSSKPRAFGYSYVLGFTIPITDGNVSLSLDPFVHMFQYNSKSLTLVTNPNTVVLDNWVSSKIIGIALVLNLK